ncbi:MAG: EAL domain-containing protein [Myxococcales bacterium]|nr:EAL domain-containing protein [Myxococcales bacterium]
MSRVLLIEHDRDDARRIHTLLRPKAVVTTRPTLALAAGAIAEQPFDVVLASSSLPDAPDGRAAAALARDPRFPVILLAGADSPELCARAARSGAQDCLVKARLDREELDRAIVSAIHRHEALVQYRALLEHCPDGVVIVDGAGVVVFANPAATRAFERELVGSELGIPLVGDDVTELALRSGRTAELHVAEVPWRGRPASMMMLRDVTDRVRATTELAAANEQLERLALVDPLTEVLNRRGMAVALERIQSGVRRHGREAAAILIDCDDFKAVNETGGYAAGDTTLQLIAKALSDAVRPATDRVGRIGGDEFLILLAETSAYDAMIVAERVRARVHAAPLAIHHVGGPRRVTVSVGVAAVPGTAGTLQEVVAATQLGLDLSKRAGKDRVTGRTPRASLASRDILDIAQDPAALRVAAQPIVRLATGARHGYEMLVRGPRGGRFESPAVLFAAASEANVLTTLDLMALRRCARASSLLPRASHVALNIYPSTLLETPSAMLLEILGAVEAPGVVVELNEQEFIGDTRLIADRALMLRDRGIRVALDDVGFGRSSLEVLVALAPDVVKLDRGVVAGVGVDVVRLRALERLVRCVDALGAELVAEGIETAADARAVAALGVAYGQGFLWGKPAILVPRDRSAN